MPIMRRNLGGTIGTAMLGVIQLLGATSIALLRKGAASAGGAH
jgi:hypothetical protein